MVDPHRRTVRQARRGAEGAGRHHRVVAGLQIVVHDVAVRQNDVRDSVRRPVVLQHREVGDEGVYVGHEVQPRRALPRFQHVDDLALVLNKLADAVRPVSVRDDLEVDGRLGQLLGQHRELGGVAVVAGHDGDGLVRHRAEGNLLAFVLERADEGVLDGLEDGLAALLGEAPDLAAAVHGRFAVEVHLRGVVHRFAVKQRGNDDTRLRVAPEPGGIVHVHEFE